MIQPIRLETEKVILHHFRAGDVTPLPATGQRNLSPAERRRNAAVHPEKCLFSLNDAEAWLNGAIVNLHAGRNTVHFITD